MTKDRPERALGAVGDTRELFLSLIFKIAFSCYGEGMSAEVKDSLQVQHLHICNCSVSLSFLPHFFFFCDRFNILPRLTLNLQSSCLGLFNVGMTDISLGNLLNIRRARGWLWNGEGGW